MTTEIKNRKIWAEFFTLDGNTFTINKNNDDNNLKIDFSVEKDVRFDPNVAEIRIWGLSEKHSNSLNFRYDINQKRYGARVKLYAGYKSNNSVRLLFDGNITQAETGDSGDGMDITYIRAMHLIQNLAGGVIKRTFAKGTKVSKIAKELVDLSYKDSTAEEKRTLSKQQEALISEKLGGKDTLKRAETWEGPLLKMQQKFSSRFSKELHIFFNENGPQFLAPGESNGDDPVRLSKNTGLIGSVQITEIGANMTCAMNTAISNGTPLHIKSRKTKSLAPSQEFAIYIAEKIRHTGTNYEGPFTTEVKALYEGGPLEQIKVG